MSTAGLLVVLARITDPILIDDVFNQWYTDHHVVDVINTGMADNARRFQNLNPVVKYKYLCLYRIPDVSKVGDPELAKKIPMAHKILPRGKEIGNFSESDIRLYIPIQSFEGPRQPTEERPKVVLTVNLEPAEGGDDDMDDWYRKQHLDILSTLPNYRRSTRYRSADDSKPRYLTVHECDSADLDSRIVDISMKTDWAKKVLGGAQAFETAAWQFIAEKGKIKEKL